MSERAYRPSLVDEDEVDSYLEAALWSSTDESDESGGEPLDRNYDVDDFSQEARLRARVDLERFRFEMDRVLDVLGDERHELNLSDWPYHFWLNRNGHGIGFWDHRDDYGSATEAFEAIAKRAGEVYVYVGDDGQVHFG